MTIPRTVRDPALIDALDRLPRSRFSGTVWRIDREGRDPAQCSASGGRWDDGSFDVLYTSLQREGALAEMHFHLSRGQPVFPTRLRYALYELQVKMHEVITLPTVADIEALGLQPGIYGQMLYVERQGEYPRTQDIGEAARFLGCDGLIAPSARLACQNGVLFCGALQPGAVTVTHDHGLIDWSR